MLSGFTFSGRTSEKKPFGDENTNVKAFEHKNGGHVGVSSDERNKDQILGSQSNGV